MKTCGHCSKDLHAWRSRRARFCSVRCRVANFRARRKLPAEMKRRDCWVRRGENKRPLTFIGAAASVTASHTWATYTQAQGSKAGDGLGFVLDGSGIGCLDLDHAFDQDGNLHPWAQEVLDANPKTFTEVSVSGQGLHIWGYLDHAPGRKIRDGRNIEIYSMGRYIALGRPLRGATNELKPLILPV